MMKFRIFGIAGAAILALALNGCGSSSDTSDTSDTMEEMLAPTPTALESAEMELSTAETALAAAAADTATTDAMLLAAQEGVEDAANALLELHAADADTAHGVVDAVRTKIKAIEAAIAMTEGRIAADVAAAVATAMAIADARTALTAAGAAMAALDEDATNAETLAAQSAVLTAAEAVVAALGDAATDTDTAAVTMAMAAVYSTSDRITTADAVALAAAVMVNVDDLTGGPFHASEESGRNFVVEVERKSAAAAMITVTDQKRTNMHTADDVDLDDGDAPPAINKYWSGSGSQRGTDEYVAVYTDIAAPTPRAFFDIDDNGGKYTSADDADTTPTHLELIVYVDQELAPPEDVPLSHWEASVLVKAPVTGGEHIIEFEDDDTTENIDEDAFKGTYDGASGEFECTTATCTLTIDDEGELIAATGGWTFTPEKGATVLEVDADYLWFGYWLQTTTNDDGTSSYSFQSDSGGSGSMPYVATHLEAVAGSAEYVGAAGGMYMQKEVNPDGSFDPATGVAKSGMFTATAALNANFGGTEVAADDAFTISGTISDFMDGEDDLGWSVELMEVEFGPITDGRDVTSARSRD